MTKIYKCFPDGKFKVLTMSYDDGKDEDRRLVALFNQYGIKGTFHINSGIKGDPRRTTSHDEYKELYKGHEVAAHTYNHPTIERCLMEQVVQQVLEDRKNLEEIMGYPVRGLSYPNGSYSKEIEEVLPHLGIKYSRIVGSSENFAMPRNLYEWQSTCHHNNKLQQFGEQFIELAKSQYLFMMYVRGHSYEFTDANNWDVIENFCKLVGNREDTWYATNIQIVDYLKVLDNVQFSAAGTFAYNPSVQSAWFNIDGKIVEIKGGEQVTFA